MKKSKVLECANKKVALHSERRKLRLSARLRLVENFHDAVSALTNTEVDQLIWVFRNGSDFMKLGELQQLSKHIREYHRVIDVLLSSGAVQYEKIEVDAALAPVLPANDK